MRIIHAQDRIADCIAIRTTVFVDEQGVPIELEIDELDKPDSGCRHFLMLEHNPDGSSSPIGTFRAYFETPEVVHLQRLCILKAFRGRGYGRAALEYVEGYFKELGASRIIFGAQCYAIPFYEKCGCRCISEVFNDAGIPHRMMEKPL